MTQADAQHAATIVEGWLASAGGHVIVVSTNPQVTLPNGVSPAQVSKLSHFLYDAQFDVAGNELAAA